MFGQWCFDLGFRWVVFRSKARNFCLGRPSRGTNIFIKTTPTYIYIYIYIYIHTHVFFIIYTHVYIHTFLFDKLYIYTHPTKKIQFSIFNQNYV